jgi:adenylate kinase family enzyme
MRRIVVVGCSGSGKTTLALGLGCKLGLPVIHLDVLYWRPGWKEPGKENFRARVAESIAANGWVVDGSFSGLVMDLTVTRADLMIVIERPRGLCLWRVLWRSAFQRDGQRPDLPEGCPEQFDWKLIREAWRYGIDRAPRVEAERLKHAPNLPVVRLRSNHEIARFVEAAA